MGIHNSSHLSTEWRVKNHINMKAFMTICALLAGSASADPQLIQNLVAFKQQTDIPLIPYQVASLPLNPISYTNLFDYRMDPATYTIGYPTLINQGLIKREAEPETPYAYESKVENPEDGSKYQFDVRVEQDGQDADGSDEVASDREELAGPETDGPSLEGAKPTGPEVVLNGGPKRDGHDEPEDAGQQHEALGSAQDQPGSAQDQPGPTQDQPEAEGQRNGTQPDAVSPDDQT